MPRIFNFYVINPAKLPPVRTDEGQIMDAIECEGARWAQVECRTVAMDAAVEPIDAALGPDPFFEDRLYSSAYGAIGFFAPAEAKSIYERMSALPASFVTALENDQENDHLADSVFWAIRDTLEEAARRGHAAVVLCTG